VKIIAQIIVFILTFSLASQGNHAEQISIPLSSPGKSGVLVVNHHKGSVNVTGYNGEMVIVRASMPYGTDDTASEGCDIYLNAIENNNHVIINAAPSYRTIDVDILVPQQFSVRLRNDDSGTISVERLSGEIEASNINGDITLTEISGSAVLDTVDGDIKVSFEDVPPSVPMAFSTVEGNIEVSFPENSNILIKARSDCGIIRNEFISDASAGNRETLPTVSDNFEAGKWNYYKINGGGSEIRVVSFLGNIYINRPEED
jgi:hypothetical protein